MRKKKSVGGPGEGSEEIICFLWHLRWEVNVYNGNKEIPFLKGFPLSRRSWAPLRSTFSFPFLWWWWGGGWHREGFGFEFLSLLGLWEKERRVVGLGLREECGRDTHWWKGREARDIDEKGKIFRIDRYV